MVGFGALLGGLGKSYPAYQQQQMDQQMQQQKLKEALMQMAQGQQDRQAGSQALQSFGGMQGSGPGGAVTPQQLAQASGGNIAAFQMLNQSAKPSIQGMYNLAGRDLTGQYGLDRTQMAGDNAMQRVNAQQAGANQRNDASIDSRQSIVGQQQAGANQRNDANIGSRQYIIGQQQTGMGDRQQQAIQAAAARTAALQAGANQRNQLTNTTRVQAHAANPSGSLSPEYRTAKAEFDEATRDEQSIQNNYGRMGNFSGYLNDPEWAAARKRKVAAQTKLDNAAEKQQKEVTKDSVAGQTPAPIPSIPPEVAKLLKEGTITTFGNGQKWTLQGGQPLRLEVTETRQPMSYQTTETVPANQDQQQQQAAKRADEAKKNVFQQMMDKLTDPAAQQMYRQ